MTLQLDPRYPLVWRSPDTIQLGIDRPLAIVPGVTAPLESVIAALRAGIPRSGALMLGRQAGATDAATAALLDALAPALVGLAGRPGLPGAESGHVSPTTIASAGFTDGSTPAGAVVRRVVCVDGAGPTADRIRGLLADLGMTVVTLPQPARRMGQLNGAQHARQNGQQNGQQGGRQSGPDQTGRLTATQASPVEPDLAVIVDHFVLAPDRHGRWLRRDLPHLPVLFSDTEARVGPLVEPGAGPCLTCLELDRVDADPAWPAIASQLLHRTAPTESVRLAIEVATTVAGIVHNRLFGGSNEFAAASVAIDADTLSVRRRAHRPHERCGCRFLPESVIVRAGNAVGFRPRTN